MRFREPGAFRAERQVSAEYLARDRRPSEASGDQRTDLSTSIPGAATPGEMRAKARVPAVDAQTAR